MNEIKKKMNKKNLKIKFFSRNQTFKAAGFLSFIGAISPKITNKCYLLMKKTKQFLLQYKFPRDDTNYKATEFSR